MMKEALRNRPGSVGFRDSEQTNFADVVSLRQPLIELGQFLVEGEGTCASYGDHAKEPLFVQADGVVVLVIEAIDKPAGDAGAKMRDLLHEGVVSEPVNLLELGEFGRHFEN